MAWKLALWTAILGVVLMAAGLIAGGVMTHLVGKNLGVAVILGGLAMGGALVIAGLLKWYSLEMRETRRQRARDDEERLLRLLD